MHIVFRADSSPRVGGGHAMRCLAFADELARAGANVEFVAASMTQPLAGRIETAGHRLTMIQAGAELALDREDWDSVLLSPAAQREDACAMLSAVSSRPDWIVVDHYRLGKAWEEQARKGGGQIFVIDDLANRAHDGNLLLDQTLGREPADYAPWVRDGCKLLLGPTYAVLRPEFAAERPAALARRRKMGPVRRMLVSMGSGDLDGVTLTAVRAARGAVPYATIDVVVAPGAISYATVEAMAAADERIVIHSDPSSMAALMRDADLAVGAAGTTSWERCCLGLPTVTLGLAANQRDVLSRLADCGAILVATDNMDIAPRVEQLATDDLLRQRMAAAAFAIADGLGGKRVGRALFGQGVADLTLAVRPAKTTDSETIWLWRNHPETRARSRSHAAVPWREHERWFAETVGSPGRRQYVVAADGSDAALVRFDNSSDGTEVSINLAPEMRGRGLGRTALALAIEAHRAHMSHPIRLIATIHKDHQASAKIFESLGFRFTGVLVADGFALYEYADPDIPDTVGKV